ncbi:hypothetical protein DITRI_Ditri03aG0175800 [Diplodiscus trichospermus]
MAFQFTQEMRGAKAMIDGNLVVNDKACTTDGLREVELLLPFMKDMYIEACSQKNVIGVVNFTSSVCSFSFLNSKEPTSQVVADVKEFESRLDIICDEADEDLAPSDDGISKASNDSSSENPVSQLVLHSLRKSCHLLLPRRVFVPWLAGTLISDYIQSTKTLEVLKDHCVELMSMEAPNDASTIFEPEDEALRVVSRSFWDVLFPYTSATSSSQEKSREIISTGSSQKTNISPNINLIAAASSSSLQFQ